MDLVFVDAGHEYHDVRDSENALRMVSESGVVVWDDYHPRHPGVQRALNEVGRRHRLDRIARTRFVIYEANVGAARIQAKLDHG